MVPKAYQLSLIIWIAASLYAKDWYISYRAENRFGQIGGYHLYLSPAMVPLHAKAIEICHFSTETSDFKRFARAHEDRLLQCLMPLGVIVKSNQTVDRFMLRQDSSRIILPPTPIKVEINDGSVRIYAVKSKKGDR